MLDAYVIEEIRRRERERDRDDRPAVELPLPPSEPPSGPPSQHDDQGGGGGGDRDRGVVIIDYG